MTYPLLDDFKLIESNHPGLLGYYSFKGNFRGYEFEIRRYDCPLGMGQDVGLYDGQGNLMYTYECTNINHPHSTPVAWAESKKIYIRLLRQYAYDQDRLRSTTTGVSNGFWDTGVHSGVRHQEKPSDDIHS